MIQSDSSQDSSPLETQLKAVRSQLGMYVRDLKDLLVTEEQKTQQLGAVNSQLQAYAHDLKVAYDTERQKSQELEHAYADTLVRLTLASRYKDEETGAHIQRLSHYSKTLALFCGLSSEEAERIFLTAPMHDVGKVGVPDAIMMKKEPLNASEWDMIKQHPTFGANLLSGSGSPLLETARDIALTHHERWDGSGYPQGLRGEAIPFAGRIVMLVDTYDALRSKRPYKPPFSHRKTCDLILNGSDRTTPSHFDPRLLKAFQELHFEFDAIFTRIDERTTRGFPFFSANVE